jgi:CheY-like chemotaxis protein
VIEGLVEDISNAQRALREAEAANRAKDAFLANLSHELRTPLNAMVGWVRLLRMGSLDVRQAERALETIERNAHAQARLIDELLDLSRIVTGNLKLELRPVDLSAAIRAMMDAMGPHARDKRVQLRAEVDPTIGPVLGDAVRLQQALGNLLSNAIKFTPAGGTVGVRLARAGPSHAEIAVTDTGKGIASHLLPHIFDGFRQGDMTCAPAHRGLGLTIARQLVELHGGAMRAHSAGEGCGTTVTVTLPVPPNLPERATRQPSPARYELLQPETLQLQGLYVLIVEDDPDVCELLTVALERWGARVAVATGAREAFTLFVTTHPDIVVSDIAMPEEDGYSLIRRLRAAESGGRRVPAIAVTAFASEDHRAEALAAGFDVHLPKPVQLPDLGRLVAELGAGRAPAR